MGEGSAHKRHRVFWAGGSPPGTRELPAPPPHPTVPPRPLRLPCPLLLLCPRPCRGRNGDPSVLFLRQGPILLPLLLCTRGWLMPGQGSRETADGQESFQELEGAAEQLAPPPPVPHSGDRGGPAGLLISGHLVAPGMEAAASSSRGRAVAVTSAGCYVPPARPVAVAPRGEDACSCPACPPSGRRAWAPTVPPRGEDACSCSADRWPCRLHPGPAGKRPARLSQSPELPTR